MPKQVVVRLSMCRESIYAALVLHSRDSNHALCADLTSKILALAAVQLSVPSARSSMISRTLVGFFRKNTNRLDGAAHDSLDVPNGRHISSPWTRGKHETEKVCSKVNSGNSILDVCDPAYLMNVM